MWSALGVAVFIFVLVALTVALAAVLGAGLKDDRDLTDWPPTDDE